MNTYKADRRCPKCGGVPNTVHQGRHWSIGQNAYTKRDDGSAMTEGTIHRECQRCHYSWGELPLDANGGLTT